MGQEFCCLNKSIYTCSLESFSAIENEACLFEVTCIKCFGFFRVVVVIGWAGVAILRINCAPEVRRLSSMAHGESRSPSWYELIFSLQFISADSWILKLHVVNIAIKLDGLDKINGTSLDVPMVAPFLCCLLLSKMLGIVYFPPSGLSFTVVFVKSVLFP